MLFDLLVPVSSLRLTECPRSQKYHTANTRLVTPNEILGLFRLHRCRF